jgi:hypothetical protein
MSLESVVILPPYWFVPGTSDPIPLKDRIEKLMEMRQRITSEITFLKSLLAKQGKFSLIPNAGN